MNNLIDNSRQTNPVKRRVPHESWSLTEELAGDRNRMASERTLMGWIRTSLAMISFGFGLAKFFDYLRYTQPQQASQLGNGPEYVGQFLLFLGTFLIHRSLAATHASTSWGGLLPVKILPRSFSGPSFYLPWGSLPL